MGGDSKFFGWGGQPLMGGDYPTLPNQNGIFAAHIEFIYCLSTSLLTSHPPIFQTLSRLHLYCIQTSSIFHQTATRLNLNFIEIYLKFILAFQSSSWVYLKLIFFCKCYLEFQDFFLAAGRAGKGHRMFKSC